MVDVRIGLLAIGGWLVAAVLTVGVSWSAISVVRDAVAPAAEVAAALPTPDEPAGPTASTTPDGTAGSTASTTPRPSATPRPSSSAAEIRSVSGRGGTASARCVDGRAVIVNVVPRQGYAVDSDGDESEAEFRSAAGRTEITATCVAGVPRFEVEEKDESGSGRGEGDDD